MNEKKFQIKSQLNIFSVYSWGEAYNIYLDLLKAINWKNFTFTFLCQDSVLIESTVSVSLPNKSSTFY